jgi:CDGSH-type Zn-finger protein
MSEPKLQITVSETGSYKVEGPITLIDHEGEKIETREGKPFFLCRCGLSANKPFCDGAHNRHPWEHELANH